MSRASPAPALPPEVREAIFAAARALYDGPDRDSLAVAATDIVAQAVAPLWLRPAAVTADAEALAERAYRIAMLACGRDGVLTPMDKPGIDDIAAVLAPVVRERDQLRAALAPAKQEVERLKLEQLRLVNAASYGSSSAVAASERAMQQFTVEQLHGMVADLRAEVERLTKACDAFSNAEILAGDLRTQLAAAQAQAREAMEALKAVQVVRERIVKAIPEYAHEMNLVDRALDAARREGGAR